MVPDTSVHPDPWPLELMPPQMISLQSASLHPCHLWSFLCPIGNGFIEGKELESFFKELEEARRGAGVVSEGTKHSFWLVQMLLEALTFTDWRLFLSLMKIAYALCAIVCVCVCVCVSHRTPLTPHSEKGWRSSCRTLTRTKMAALKCPR